MTPQNLTSWLPAVTALVTLVALAQDEAPRVIAPGGDQAPPSDAVVLFDGTNLDEWESARGGEAKWALEDGAMVVTKTGGLVTKQKFGDHQLHLEFATPAEVKGQGQGRGNSGVYLQGRYEVQVLDSFENATYPNGQCGAIYGQSPPLVNACRAPGEWQSYDIIFREARFDDDGKLARKPRLTVFHNGVLIQDHFEISGTTAASRLGAGAEDGPLFLQDHGNPVRYRNIWVREL